jgi:asparagine synthase (glutamine-hydrolysing)
MCGIAGFVGPWSESLLGAMNTALRHRGPDGEGIFHDPAAGIGLAHRRLAIIDLSEAAAQPMASADGRYQITYNGEIYNYRALRDELERDGVGFRSRSDTEVLLALYMRDGADCLERLHGIFAFAVWDAVDRRLFVARDPLGVKPLYYAETANGFLFASELKALVLCADVARDIDPVAVADHLGFLWTAGEATMLKSVRKLRPGTALTVEGTHVTVRRYWRPPLARPDPCAAASPTSPSALTALIDSVVREQMVADVPVGALLSGGVDSSAIVAAMCRTTAPENITTFCAAVPDRGGRADNFGDDLDHARLVAESFGVKLVEVPTEADLIGGLADMVWSLDEPTADFAALQTWMLARAARDSGIKVLLSGVGGDDLFTGYARHRAAMIYAVADRVPGARRLLGAVLKWVPASTVSGRRLQRLGQLLALPEDEMVAEAMSFSAVTAQGRLELLAPEIRAQVPGDGIPAPFRDSLARTKGRHPVERFIDLELGGFLPDHNLNYTDKMAMRAGVEVRVPLVATQMVDFAANLTLSERIDLRRTKKILRDSQARRLPPAVLARPKQGFGVPLRAWLHGPARPLLDELTAADVVERRGLFDAAAVARLREAFHGQRIDAALTLFPLMAIELWCRALDAAPTADPP